MKNFMLIICLCTFSFLVQAKEIAITFDDTPRNGSALSSQERTQLLLANLKKSDVKTAAFFIKTSNINKSNAWQLASYQKSGHILANHSHSHWWLHKTDAEKYQNDILTAHGLLKGYKNFKPWYRYPYLDEGRTHEKNDQIRDFLSEQNYINGYVTVDTYDWYMDSLYQTAVKADKHIDRGKLKQLYVDTLIESIDFYDSIAVKHLGRSPKHVLLLHENDLAAYFIDDLVMALKEQGWSIISPEEAYKDPIAQQTPKTLFKGQGRVAALAHDKRSTSKVKARELISKNEDEAYLDQLFANSQVFKDQCDINSLSFLQGDWIDDSSKNTTTETWNKTSEHTFEGYGEAIQKETGTIRSQEALMITEMDGQIFYIAKPTQNALPASFPLVSCNDNVYNFINEQHDFPQQIIYLYSPAETDGTSASKEISAESIDVEVLNNQGHGFRLHFTRPIQSTETN